jgi:hypothetical protein
MNKLIINQAAARTITMGAWRDVDWIVLAEDRDRWRALVNVVMNLRGSIKCWEKIECPNN